MTRYKEQIVLNHRFVEFIPRELEAHTVYVSITYATVIHNCCCGCGNRVVTPLSPTDWKLIFDGRTISLNPSIGNWSFPCRSHYWIRNNRVVWADDWTDEEVAAARIHDARATEKYLRRGETDETRPAGKNLIGNTKRSLGQRFRDWIGKPNPRE